MLASSLIGRGKDLMQYTFLGRTGMKVSRFCLGTWNFGTYTDEKEAFRIMDAAVEAGINFFDTANHYPDFEQCGKSEEIIGRWFSQGEGRREKVILATKVYQPMMNDQDGPNNDPGLSAYKIRRHLIGSLHRLQTDHIELYQMHHIDRRTSWEETWEAFQVLINQGKVGYVGSSNFAGWHLMEAQAYAKQKGMMGLVCEQHRYSLLCRMPELEVLPAAKHLGIGGIAYSPLGAGLLSGNALNPGKGSRTAVIMKNSIPKYRDQLERYSLLCKEWSDNEADVALSWVLRNPAMNAVIIGPRTLEQFKGSLSALSVDWNEEKLKALDELFPGPGGEAPEAYAW